MAEGIQDTTAASTSSETAAAVPTKKFPRGVVLGKDGKPCRSCTSFADWAAHTKQSTRPSSSSTTTSPSQAPSQGSVPPENCPPDTALLGRSTWTLLHTLSAHYPVSPSLSEKTEMSTFLTLFARLYPCWTCAEDFQVYMARERVRLESRQEFGQWLCEAHNEVNRKLGKGVFDCGRWEERWGEGGEGCG